MNILIIILIALAYILCGVGFGYIFFIATDYNPKSRNMIIFLSIFWIIILFCIGFADVIHEIEYYLKYKI